MPKLTLKPYEASLFHGVRRQSDLVLEQVEALKVQIDGLIGEAQETTKGLLATIAAAHGVDAPAGQVAVSRDGGALVLSWEDAPQPAQPAPPTEADAPAPA